MPQDEWIDIDDDQWEDIPATPAPEQAKELPQLSPMQASMQGLGGYIQGAIGDLPSTLMNSLKSIGLLALDPVTAAKKLTPTPSGVAQRINQAWETTKSAGADPAAFGRMMGQTTGQPLATEGLATGAPLRALGYPIAGAGRIIQQYTPLSGFIPSRALGIRNLYQGYRLSRAVERGIGRNIVEPVGEYLKRPDKLAGLSKMEVPFSSSGASFPRQVPFKYGVPVPTAGPLQLGAGTSLVTTRRPPNPDTPRPAARDSATSKMLTTGSAPKVTTTHAQPSPRPPATPPTNVSPRFNPRGQTGLTGIAQTARQAEVPAPRVGSRVIEPQLVDQLPSNLEPTGTRIASGEQIVDWNNRGTDRMGNGNVYVENLNGPGKGGYTSETNARFIEDTNRMKNERIRQQNDPVQMAKERAERDKWNDMQDNLEATTRLEKNHPNHRNISDEAFQNLHAGYLKQVKAERVKGDR